MRIIVILFLVLIVASLGSSLFFLYKDRGGHGKTRVVKALTVRVGLSILLFVLLMAGFRFGLITGHL